jgi:flagellar operon protein
MNSLHIQLSKNKVEQPRAGVKPNKVQSETAQSSSFHEILGNQLQENAVQFSKHATIRLSDRNINLTNDQMERVAGGIGQADEKGIRDSLVLVDDVALVVNVKSRTVITALNQVTNNVFSNIDGAVVV